MKLIFCMQITIKLSYQLIQLILLGVAKHAQITQNLVNDPSFSQYGISYKCFLHWINSLCNINSLLLFQVTVDPWKLACKNDISFQELSKIFGAAELEPHRIARKSIYDIFNSYSL